MNDMIFDRDYTALLMAALANTSTPGAEIEVQLSIAPQSETGFLVIDQGDAVREEVLFYHRKSWSSVYVYWINRFNPIGHDANASVLLTNSIDALNFLSDNTFQQMFIFKTSDKELKAQWGKFYIDWKTVDIADLNTLDALANKILTAGDTNFITIKDGDYNISTTYDENLYQVAEVAVNSSWVITSIERNKVFSLSWKTLDQSQIDKLATIEEWAEENVQSDYNETDTWSKTYIVNKPDLSGYEVKTSKVWTIGVDGSTFKYPTTKAVRDELKLLVPKVTGKDLSDNNLTDEIIDTINNKVDKVSGKELSENNFSDTDKAKLDWLSDYAWIDFTSWNNVNISEVVDGNWHKDISISAVTNINLGTQSSVMADIRPIGDGSNWAYYEYSEWDRYIVLKNQWYNWFDGKVLTPLDADDINWLRVYVKNEWVAWQLKLQLLIRVTDSVWAMVDTIRSIPFNANIWTGETFFDIPVIQFAWLWITWSNNIYFKIIRDASRSIESDADTVWGRLLVSSAVVDFNIPPSAIPVLPTHNYDIAPFSNTWLQGYVINISMWPVLEDWLFIPFMPDISNIWSCNVNYNSTWIKDIVTVDGLTLPDNSIIADKLTFISYDLANDRWKLLWTSWSWIWSNQVYAYEHTQTVAASTWNVNHNLLTKQVILQCYDVSGNPIEPNTYSFIDDDNISVEFTGNVAGTVVLLTTWWSVLSVTWDKHYEEDFANVDWWGTYLHNLWKYPSIVVLDAFGVEVVTEVKHNNANSITITWVWTHSWKIVAN